MIPDNHIYTIGTGLRSSEDFIEILSAYEIKAFIDVRSYPRSKLPYFSWPALAYLLKSNQIDYYLLNHELGGFRKGGYAAFTVTAEFSKGIERLEAIAKERVSVIACAEKYPWKCHRRWISRELQKRGWIVEHIIEKGKVWIPK